MNKVLNCKNTKAGSKKSNKPRHWNRNTDLCVDMKTILRIDRIAMIGKDYQGVLRHDKEYHYTFTEIHNVDKRNPRVFDGRYITITLRNDGSLRPNFKEVTMGHKFNIDDYATGVSNELRKALTGLVGERRVRK
jgi:hypothetical protein